MVKTTDKHLDILGYIYEYKNRVGYAPTIRDICKEFDIASTSTGLYWLGKLQKLGYLTSLPHAKRSWVITETGHEELKVYFAALVALGTD